MSRFLLAVMPFAGHIGPMLALASELSERGHDVRVYTGGKFRTRTEAAGARHVPWQSAPDFEENDLPAVFPRLVGKKGMSQLFINLTDLFIGTAPAQLADLEAEYAREPWDVLVSEETSLGSCLFAEKRGGRWATAAVAPLSLPSSQGPPSGLGLRPGGSAVSRGRDALLRGVAPVLSAPLQRAMRRTRVAAGLAPRGEPFASAPFSRELVLATGVPSLDHQRTDRSSHITWVGRLSAPTDTVEPLPGWWADLEGRRVTHVTQGTQNLDPADLLRPSISALADRDVLVVATTGIPGQDELPFPVPENVRVAGFVPHDALLPHVDVVVSNGGWGGILAALAHGIPLVIAAGDLDKPEVAARIASAGAGVNLRTGRPPASAIQAAVDLVIRDPSYGRAASRIAEELREAGGAARAADALERLAGRR